MGKDKIVALSFMQVLYAALVVLGHSFHQCPYEYSIPVLDWMTFFRMPLSMWISGWLLAYTTSRHGKDSVAPSSLSGCHDLLWKKVKRLLVPYAAISILAFFPKFLFAGLTDHQGDLSVTGFFRMLLFPEENPIQFFWFLPTLFLIFITVFYGSYLLRRIGWKLPSWLVLGALLIFYYVNPFQEVGFFMLKRVAMYFLYFALGYYCYRWGIVEAVKERPLTALGVSAVLSLLLYLVDVLPGRPVLLALAGILLVLSLGHLYERTGWKWMHPLFGSSYCIYLFSWFPLTFSQQLLGRGFGLPWQWCTILAFTLGILVPWVVYRVLQRVKGVPVGRQLAFLAGHS